jgi:hypothetical protein
MARPVPVGRVACVGGADLSAVVLASRVAPHAAWWVPWVTGAGGLLVLAGTFGLMWLLVWWQHRGGRIWRRPAEIPPAGPPAVSGGYVLRIEPGWPRSEWPRPVESRKAITGPGEDRRR